LLNLLGKLLPAQEAQGLFYGGALIVILLVARDGLLGRIHRWLSPFRRVDAAVHQTPAASTVAAPEVLP
jgi:hypothetical protein